MYIPISFAKLPSCDVKYSYGLESSEGGGDEETM